MDRDQAPGFRSRLTGGRASQSKAFIGDMVSLIYSPFLVKHGILFDAILDSPAPECPEMPPDDLPLEPDPECKMRFIPMLCPTCGWDLEGDKNALVLLCSNCDSAWQAAGESFEKVDFGFLPGNNDASLYLPFWRIQATISGAKLKSYADLIRLANLPKAIQSQWEKRPVAFWIPAFKIHPQLFLRLARLFTTSQSSADAQNAVPHSPLHAVTLPLAEAVESIKVLITSLAVQKDSILSLLSETMITPDECSLVYCPFVLKGTELIHPTMQVSISANALNWGKLL